MFRAHNICGRLCREAAKAAAWTLFFPGRTWRSLSWNGRVGTVKAGSFTAGSTAQRARAARMGDEGKAVGTKLQSPSSYLIDFFGLSSQCAFPGERISNNGCEIVESRLPTERPADELGIGHDLHCIAGAARCIVDPEVDA